jgi:transposase InsO family protein
MITAKDQFQNPTKRVNQLWQTDFTYFKVMCWSGYYLSTVLDDYSRCILAWKLRPTLNTPNVQKTLELSQTKPGVDRVNVFLRPRLLSGNGPCYFSKDLKDYLNRRHIEHTHSAPYHPMTPGKIECYQRSRKNVLNLQNNYFPAELEREIVQFLRYYYNQRKHESSTISGRWTMIPEGLSSFWQNKPRSRNGLYKRNACRICWRWHWKYNKRGSGKYP